MVCTGNCKNTFSIQLRTETDVYKYTGHRLRLRLNGCILNMNGRKICLYSQCSVRWSITTAHFPKPGCYIGSRQGHLYVLFYIVNWPGLDITRTLSTTRYSAVTLPSPTPAPNQAKTQISMVKTCVSIVVCNGRHHALSIFNIIGKLVPTLSTL